MVESDSAEDEGNALKNRRGQRLVSAALQAAEWERGTRMFDAGRHRRAWLSPLSFTAAFGGRSGFPPLSMCRQRGCGPTNAEGALLCETCALDANLKLRVVCGYGPQESSAMLEMERELVATHTAQGLVAVSYLPEPEPQIHAGR